MVSTLPISSSLTEQAPRAWLRGDLVRAQSPLSLHPLFLRLSNMCIRYDSLAHRTCPCRAVMASELVRRRVSVFLGVPWENTKTRGSRRSVVAGTSAIISRWGVDASYGQMMQRHVQPQCWVPCWPNVSASQIFSHIALVSSIQSCNALATLRFRATNASFSITISMPSRTPVLEYGRMEYWVILSLDARMR